MKTNAQLHAATPVSAPNRSWLIALGRLRFATFSLLVHSVLVVILGGVVLTQMEAPVPDFEASPQGFTVSSNVENQHVETQVELSQINTVNVTPVSLTSVAPAITTISQNSTFSAATLIRPTLGSLPGADAGVAAAMGSNGAGTGTGTGMVGRAGGRMTFMGMTAKAASVVFVVDVSGSMISGEKSEKTYRALEREVVKFIRDLDDRVNFGMVVFSQDARTFQPRLARAGSEEKERAVNWLKKHSPENIHDRRASEETKSFHHGTRADRGLAEAFALAPDVIYFISDGEPTGTNAKDVFNLVQNLQLQIGKGTVVNAVAYLADSGQAFMQELAARNGGTFKEINPHDVR